MAEQIYFDDEVEAEAEAPKAIRSKKLLKWLIIVAVLFLAAELVWLFGISPFRPFSRIEITGYEGIERAEIIARSGLQRNSSYVSTDPAAIEQALMGFSSLESVRVIKSFPDRLSIDLQGRRPVAFTLAFLDSRTVPVFFDSQGVIFQIGQDSKNLFLQQRLPAISGLVIENPYLGMQLPLVFEPLLWELEKITLSAPELISAISEFRINRRPYDGFDLILYLMHSQIRVRLSELNEDLLRYTLLMVDVLASAEEGIHTLDFRSGIASYVPQGGSL
ncbi:MAG: FtsQ-type POTRA domain-containing protein [Treponema sp.]|nr:FtsQ-type POTRA domain-containing protein [Treponema sp.]